METNKCCICGADLNGYGNNPEGAMHLNDNDELVKFDLSFSENDRCCDACNLRYVLPGRLYKLYEVHHKIDDSGGENNA